MSKVLVFGIGNYVQSDDGFGVHVIKELVKEQDSLPAGTVLLDAGTSIVDQISDIAEAERMICVDVVEGGGAPGTIYKFRPEDVQYRVSKFHHVHKINIFDTLEMVRTMEGRIPDTTIIAIQPEHIDWGIELSPSVREKMPEFLSLVREEIAAE